MQLGFTRLTVSPTIFLTATATQLPLCLKNIVVGSSLPTPDFLLYDFPPTDLCPSVDVPIYCFPMGMDCR